MCERCDGITDESLLRARQDDALLSQVGPIRFRHTFNLGRPSVTIVEPRALLFSLTGVEMVALSALLKAYPGEATSQDIAWLPDSTAAVPDAENTARLRVSRLRQKFLAQGLPVGIYSVWSRGYRLEVE